MEPLSSEECVHLTQFFCFQGYYCHIGWGHMCQGMYTEVRGQDCGALLPFTLHTDSSGRTQIAQLEWQVPLPPEPSQ